MKIEVWRCNSGWMARFYRIPEMPEEEDVELPFERHESLIVVADDLARSFPQARVSFRP